MICQPVMGPGEGGGRFDRGYFGGFMLLLCGPPGADLSHLGIDESFDGFGFGRMPWGRDFDRGDGPFGFGPLGENWPFGDMAIPFPVPFDDDDGDGSWFDSEGWDTEGWEFGEDSVCMRMGGDVYCISEGDDGWCVSETGEMECTDDDITLDELEDAFNEADMAQFDDLMEMFGEFGFDELGFEDLFSEIFEGMFDEMFDEWDIGQRLGRCSDGGRQRLAARPLGPRVAATRGPLACRGAAG